MTTLLTSLLWHFTTVFGALRIICWSLLVYSSTDPGILWFWNTKQRGDLPSGLKGYTGTAPWNRCSLDVHRWHLQGLVGSSHLIVYIYNHPDPLETRRKGPRPGRWRSVSFPPSRVSRVCMGSWFFTVHCSQAPDVSTKRQEYLFLHGHSWWLAGFRLPVCLVISMGII